MTLSREYPVDDIKISSVIDGESSDGLWSIDLDEQDDSYPFMDFPSFVNFDGGKNPWMVTSCLFDGKNNPWLFVDFPTFGTLPNLNCHKRLRIINLMSGATLDCLYIFPF